jgi:hypothetical protein
MKEMRPMPILTFALPLPADRVEALREFVGELLGSRRAEFEASWRAKGIVAERAWLQSAPTGMLVLVSIEAGDLLRAMHAIATSDTPFDRWYRQRVRDIYGVDLADESSRPQIELLAEWTAQ